MHFVTIPTSSSGVSMMVNCTWPIGIVTTVDSFIRAPPYLFNNVQAASMRFAAVIGSIFGWFLGYLFNEYISKSRTQQSSWRPEYRLFGVFVPAIFECAGLLLFGLGNQFKLSWVALAFSWFMVNIGLVGTIVAITAFVLEKYPARATTVSAIVNMWRTCGKSSRSRKHLLYLLVRANGIIRGFLCVLLPSRLGR